MSAWRFGAIVLAVVATAYLAAAIAVFIVTDNEVVPSGLLATGSAITGSLVVLVTRGWGKDHDDE